MNNSFGLKESDLINISSLLMDFPDIEEAYIFGSRAMGNYTKGSDIDIALRGDVNFEMISRINFLLNEETNMPYHFDVLNINELQNNDLIDHIERVGIKFFDQHPLTKSFPDFS